MRITIDGKRAECATFRDIKPEYWDTSKGLPVHQYHLAQSLKEYFRQMKAEVYKHYNVLPATRKYVIAQDLKQSFRRCICTSSWGLQETLPLFKLD